MWQIWLIAAGIFFILEMATTGFLVFWLGIGSVLSMIISFILPDAIILQTAIFVISSTLLILLTKPLVDKYIDKRTVPTNSYSLIGKKGLVIVDINPLDASGQVKVNGEVWSAKSENDEVISKDTEVEILKIDGVKLIVTHRSKVVSTIN